MATLSTTKKIVFSLILLALLWLVVELACLGGLWYLKRYKQVEYQPALVEDLSFKHRSVLEMHLNNADTYVTYDPELGWSIRPNMVKPNYRSNSKGIRAAHEYDLQPPAGKVRIAAFGDSFVHGDGVPMGATFEEQLEELVPGLEVMNFGIPGSDPGQGLMRYRREGIQYHPAVVLIGYMSENISRMVNTFRPFYFAMSGIPFAKPRFAVEGGKLVLYDNPVKNRDGYRELLRDPAAVLPRLGEHDYFYHRYNRRSRFDFLPSVRFARVISDQYFDQPIFVHDQYNTRSEAYQVSFRVLDQFYREALEHGSLPVIVLFPQRRELRLHRDGKPVTYQPLLDDLRRRGYRVIDLADGFHKYDPGAELANKNFIHYPRAGNEMVAEWLRDVLTGQGLTTPEGVSKALAATKAPALN
ncbi:MAG TPA: hypothetical protein VF173_08200 [Thermoanaerobaculia bacterium]|nr:hypothetical protein [Thermoanaerobaculia bacterium]